MANHTIKADNGGDRSFSNITAGDKVYIERETSGNLVEKLASLSKTLTEKGLCLIPDNAIWGDYNVHSVIEATDPCFYGSLNVG